MDHFQRIYASRAADYHRMIAPEDVDGKLLSTLRAATPLTGQRILDLGTGTGRLALLLAREAAQMVGLDLHWDMLRENVVQRFFFGAEMAAKIRANGWARLPEWTGVWSKQVEGGVGKVRIEA